ncbi:MAG: hypothetical protein ACLT98_08465 [Eggerthellaceae bacterium]
MEAALAREGRDKLAELPVGLGSSRGRRSDEELVLGDMQAVAFEHSMATPG